MESLYTEELLAPRKAKWWHLLIIAVLSGAVLLGVVWVKIKQTSHTDANAFESQGFRKYDKMSAYFDLGKRSKREFAETRPLFVGKEVFVLDREVESDVAIVAPEAVIEKPVQGKLHFKGRTLRFVKEGSAEMLEVRCETIEGSPVEAREIVGSYMNLK